MTRRADIDLDPALARAFNLGSDARLAGRPESANPFTGRMDNYRQTYWRLGWRDVHVHWPDLLPPVQEDAA